jgi:hypothetical protein
MQQQVKGRKWTFSSISRTSEAPIDEERVGPSQVDKCVLALVVSVVTIAAVAIGVVMSGGTSTAATGRFSIRPADQVSATGRRLSEDDSTTEFVCDVSGRLGPDRIQFSILGMTEAVGPMHTTPYIMWDYDINDNVARWNSPMVWGELAPANETTIFDTTPFASMDEYFSTLRFAGRVQQDDATQLFQACTVYDYTAHESYTCGPAFFLVQYSSRMVNGTESCEEMPVFNLVPSLKRFVLGNSSAGLVTATATIPSRLLSAELQGETCHAIVRLRISQSIDVEYQNDTLFEETVLAEASSDMDQIMAGNLDLFGHRDRWELDRRFPEGQWTFNARGDNAWESPVLVHRADAMMQPDENVNIPEKGIRRTMGPNVSAALTARLSALDTNITDPTLGDNAPSFAWNLWCVGEIATLVPHYFYTMIRGQLMEDPNAPRPLTVNESIWNRAAASMAHEDGTGPVWLATRCGA